MRIISGQARGRKLKTLEGLDTRPTLDRTREALFNILQQRVRNARVLDLFAGSGALGLEAASRGAAHVTLVDRAAAVIAGERIGGGGEGPVIRAARLGDDDGAPGEIAALFRQSPLLNDYVVGDRA